jgi:hypothetical protein
MSIERPAHALKGMPFERSITRSARTFGKCWTAVRRRNAPPVDSRGLPARLQRSRGSLPPPTYGTIRGWFGPSDQTLTSRAPRRRLLHVNTGWTLNLHARYLTSHLGRSNAMPIECVNRQLILMLQTISKIVQEWRNRHWIGETTGYNLRKVSKVWRTLASVI